MALPVDCFTETAWSSHVTTQKMLRIALATLALVLDGEQLLRAMIRMPLAPGHYIPPSIGDGDVARESRPQRRVRAVDGPEKHRIARPDDGPGHHVEDGGAQVARVLRETTTLREPSSFASCVTEEIVARLADGVVAVAVQRGCVEFLGRVPSAGAFASTSMPLLKTALTPPAGASTAAASSAGDSSCFRRYPRTQLTCMCTSRPAFDRSVGGADAMPALLNRTCRRDARVRKSCAQG